MAIQYLYLFTPHCSPALTQVSAYLLEEQSCEISPRSNLKLQILSLLWKRSPQCDEYRSHWGDQFIWDTWSVLYGNACVAGYQVYVSSSKEEMSRLAAELYAIVCVECRNGSIDLVTVVNDLLTNTRSKVCTENYITNIIHRSKYVSKKISTGTISQIVTMLQCVWNHLEMCENWRHRPVVQELFLSYRIDSVRRVVITHSWLSPLFLLFSTWNHQCCCNLSIVYDYSAARWTFDFCCLTCVQTAVFFAFIIYNNNPIFSKYSSNKYPFDV